MTTRRTKPKGQEATKTAEAEDVKPSVETRPDDSAPGEPVDSQGLEPVNEVKNDTFGTQGPTEGATAKHAAADTQSGANSAAKTKRKVLKVTALAESFRRANLQFSRKTRTLYVDDLSEAQVKALKAESRLSVVEGEE